MLYNKDNFGLIYLSVRWQWIFCSNTVKRIVKTFLRKDTGGGGGGAPCLISWQLWKICLSLISSKPLSHAISWVMGSNPVQVRKRFIIEMFFLVFKILWRNILHTCFTCMSDFTSSKYCVCAVYDFINNGLWARFAFENAYFDSNLYFFPRRGTWPVKW